MKKLIIFAFLVAANFTFAQITTTKAVEKEHPVKQYDSTRNFLGKDVRQYIGQDLYLKKKHIDLREYGYSNFSIDYTKSTTGNKSNVYKCRELYNSKYEEMAGKYFKVLAVHKHPKAGTAESYYDDIVFLKLKEKESGDTLYYEYNVSSPGYSFPFIVVGYFEKTKATYVGTELVLRGKNWMNRETHLYDVETGDSVFFTMGSVWKCVDLTIEQEHYNLKLIIKSSVGEKLFYALDYMLEGNRYAFKKADADKYKKKFGAGNWNKILEGVVSIGFTEEMARLSWGNPNEINRSSAGPNQWVYSSRYLYFKNGKLTAFN